MPTIPFPITAGSQDGWVDSSGGSYPPGSTPSFNSTDSFIYADKEFLGSYRVGNALLKFDTSALPDNAQVTFATLRVWVAAKANINARNLTADWFTWTGTSSDYTEAAGTNALSGVAISSITANSDNDFTLSNVQNVSTSGFTYLRLHISGGQPSGQNYVAISTYEDTNTEPRLIVTYSVGGDLVGQVGI